MPFSVVIGEKEVKDKQYSLKERGKQDEVVMGIKEIIKLLNSLQKNMPFKKCNLNNNLSKQPVFFG